LKELLRKKEHGQKIEVRRALEGDQPLIDALRCNARGERAPTRAPFARASAGCSTANSHSSGRHRRAG